ncbi:MAG: hypothetical protein J5J00_09095 [Deltaproteobacteria bacterium]|nr:hypothetical protein [Deltaproteobacteria bacterium]
MTTTSTIYIRYPGEISRRDGCRNTANKLNNFNFADSMPREYDFGGRVVPPNLKEPTQKLPGSSMIG